MYLLYLLLLATPLTLPVHGKSISPKYGIFDIVGSISSGIASVGNFIHSVQELYSAVQDENNANIPEDARLNIRELTEKYGYPLRAYTVTTRDGYNLELQRISCANCTKNGIVVFLMHGILDSSDSWVIQGPGKALGYILADQGFDVWMGNARGNKYGLSHMNLLPKESDFWEFTWEEIGLYDIPAMIDYALEKSNKQSLYYIGHSQGTTSYFVMNSLKPEYNDRVKLMVALAPVAYMRNVTSPLVKIFSPANKIWGYFLSSMNTYSPSTEYLNKIVSIACSVLPVHCDNALSMVIGNDYKHLDKDFLPVILGHLPSGSSTAQLVHYGQLVGSGRFCRFDFGKEVNIKVYNQSSPPDYDISKVTSKISMFYSDSDWFTHPTDVGLLKSHLPYVISTNVIEDYNHLDLIYERVIEQIFKIEGGF